MFQPKYSTLVFCTVFGLLLLPSALGSVEPQRDASNADQHQCSREKDAESCSTSPHIKPETLNSREDYEQGTEKMRSGDDHVHEEVEEEDEGADKYRDILHRTVESIEAMLGSVEESRAQVVKKLRKLMDKMALSKDAMMERLDSVLDSVAHSRLIEELDTLLEEVANSRVIEEIKALPRELKQSFVLVVRNRSYVAAGIAMAIGAAILVGGSLYLSWCHDEQVHEYSEVDESGSTGSITTETGADSGTKEEGTVRRRLNRSTANGSQNKSSTTGSQKRSVSDIGNRMIGQSVETPQTIGKAVASKGTLTDARNSSVEVCTNNKHFESNGGGDLSSKHKSYLSVQDFNKEEGEGDSTHVSSDMQKMLQGGGDDLNEAELRSTKMAENASSKSDPISQNGHSKENGLPGRTDHLLLGSQKVDSKNIPHG